MRRLFGWANDNLWVILAVFVGLLVVGQILLDAADKAVKSGDYLAVPALTQAETGRYSCATVDGIPVYVLAQEQVGTKAYHVQYAGGPTERVPAASVVLTDCTAVGLMDVNVLFKAPRVIRLDAAENRYPAPMAAVVLSTAAFGLNSLLFITAIMASIVMIGAWLEWRRSFEMAKEVMTTLSSSIEKK
jgi:hypothetical protein